MVTGIVFGNREETFEPPEEKGGASNLAEELYGVCHVVAVGRNGARIVVEFPEERAVGIPVGAVEREVARDFVGEARIGFLHARHSRGWSRIAFRVALLEIADGFDPFADALGSRAVDAMLRRKADTLDGDGFSDARGIHSAIMQNDASAERMAHEANGKIIDDIEEGGEIEDVFGYAVGGAGGPSAVAMSAQIQREDVIMLAQDARNPIPIASVVQAAVH